LLSGDSFYRIENVPKSISAEASLRTPLRSLQRSSDPLAGGEEARCPSQESHHSLDSSGPAVSSPKHPKIKPSYGVAYSNYLIKYQIKIKKK